MTGALRSSTAACAAAVVLGVALTRAWACPNPEEGFRRLASPQAEIAYRWEPGEIKVGRFFAAEVVACRGPGHGDVRDIALDATMPAHGHGMNYRPTVTRIGPDRFRVTGLMLHMPGTWRLTFDLQRGESRIRLTEELRLDP